MNVKDHIETKRVDTLPCQC